MLISLKGLNKYSPWATPWVEVGECVSLMMRTSWNGIGRAFCESLRTDALFVGNVRISQAICITYATVAAIALVIIKSKIKNSNDPDYLKPYAMTREYLLATGQITEEPAGVPEEHQEETAAADAEPVFETAETVTDIPSEEADAAEEETPAEDVSAQNDTEEIT